jgi:hypothetical protein
MKQEVSMVTKRLALVVLAMLLLTACASTSGRTNQLRLGMSSQQVIEVMGMPDSTSSMDDVVFLKYFLSSYRLALFADNYYVRLTNGKVDAYGRVGDFGLGF